MLEHFCHLRKKSYVHRGDTSALYSIPHSPRLSISLNLPILDISYKQIAAVCCLPLLTFRIMISRCIHVTWHISALVFWLLSNNLRMDISYVLFHSSVYEPLHFKSTILTIMNDTALKIHVILCVHIYAYFLSVNSQCGIAGSYSSSVFVLSRNCLSVFQSSYTILHSHQ